MTGRPGRPRWRPAPLLHASALVHAGAAVGFLAAPGAWPAWLGALALDHALVVGAGLSPRSTWLGPNLVRLPAAAAARGEIALTFDDGPDPEVTPRVLDLLDAAGARATFFCIGRQVERAPHLVREIVARGHAVENHSLSHRHAFWFLPPAALRGEIDRLQALLGDVAGVRPRFFRAPAGFRSPLLDRELTRSGLRLASWTRRGFDTRTTDPGRVLARLARGLAPGDILLLHDGHSPIGASGRPVVLDVLPRLLDELRGRGVQSVTLGHAADSNGS